MNFDSFQLDSRILSNIQALGYKSPTPIQEKSIPDILAGSDVMGLAQTGTGKTAAFILPILQKLLTGPRSVVRAVIIAPTRELAEQIHLKITEFTKGTDLRSMTLYGGVKMGNQIKKLKRGVEIIVACPGRLLDHVERRTVDISKTEMLVLDEADQMFDMGFIPSIRRILRHVPKKRQTLLFSATMPAAINQLAREILVKPVTVEIGHSKPVTTVKHIALSVDLHLKESLLIHLLHKMEMDSVLVFTRTKHTAKKIAQTLEEAGFSATSLQGNLSQSKRQVAMSGFRDGSLKILVATDIASRGIDVLSISHVINFDIPDTAETYTHRIGRTGRANQTGEALTLITRKDASQMRNIERTLGIKIEQRLLEDFNYKAANVASAGRSSDHPKGGRGKPRGGKPYQSGDRSESSGRSRKSDSGSRSRRTESSDRSESGRSSRSEFSSRSPRSESGDRSEFGRGRRSESGDRSESASGRRSRSEFGGRSSKSESTGGRGSRSESAGGRSSRGESSSRSYRSESGDRSESGNGRGRRSESGSRSYRSDSGERSESGQARSRRGESGYLSESSLSAGKGKSSNYSTKPGSGSRSGKPAGRPSRSSDSGKPGSRSKSARPSHSSGPNKSFSKKAKPSRQHQEK